MHVWSFNSYIPVIVLRIQVQSTVNCIWDKAFNPTVVRIIGYRTLISSSSLICALWSTRVVATKSWSICHEHTLMIERPKDGSLTWDLGVAYIVWLIFSLPSIVYLSSHLSVSQSRWIHFGVSLQWWGYASWQILSCMSMFLIPSIHKVWKYINSRDTSRLGVGVCT